MQTRSKATIVAIFVAIFVLITSIVLVILFGERLIESITNFIKAESLDRRQLICCEYLRQQLKSSAFSNLKYSVILGKLHIRGTLPDDIALRSLLQEIFRGPDDLVNNIYFNIKIKDKTSLEFSRVAGASSESRYWQLLRTEYTFRTPYQLNAKPRKPMTFVKEEVEILYNRRGDVIKENVLYKLQE